jgi:hypothetical protein
VTLEIPPVFLGSLPRTNHHGDDVKKCHQTFLAPLPGKAHVKRFINNMDFICD